MKSKNIIPDQVKELLSREAPDDKDALENVWLLASNPTAKLNESEIDQAVHQFEQKLHTETSPKRNTSLYLLKRTWKVAASFAIIALASYFYFMGEVVHETPRGATAELSLPDGSTVVLNGGSALVHSRKFWGKERNVQLAGEAFFDVKRGEKPFVVTTENARIQVLGTAFNVDTWSSDSVRTLLRVTEGRVTISSESNPSAFATVIAGQESEVVGAHPPSEPRALNADLATIWLQGGIVSINEPLVALTQRLERRFSVEIDIDESLQEQHLTWIQPQVMSAQDALTDICEIVGCEMESTSDGYLLRFILEDE